MQYKASARKGPRIDRRVPGDHFVSPENGAFARKATFSAASLACRKKRPFRSQPKAAATKLDKLLKREIDIDGKPYMVTLSPDGVKLTEKGKRKGQGVSWKGLVNGESATALSLSGGPSESDSESESEHPQS